MKKEYTDSQIKMAISLIQWCDSHVSQFPTPGLAEMELQHVRIDDDIIIIGFDNNTDAVYSLWVRCNITEIVFLKKTEEGYQIIHSAEDKTPYIIGVKLNL